VNFQVCFLPVKFPATPKNFLRTPQKKTLSRIKKTKKKTTPFQRGGAKEISGVFPGKKSQFFGHRKEQKSFAKTKGGRGVLPLWGLVEKKKKQKLAFRSFKI